MKEKRGRKNNSINKSKCERLISNPKWIKKTIQKHTMNPTWVRGIPKKFNRWPRMAKTAKYGKLKIFDSRV